ncbi:MAG: HTH domain-containing protein [Natronomonas sp.]
MTDHESAERLRAVVWLRDPSPPPDDPRRAVLSRLRELDSTGDLSDVSVQIWGKSVAASGTKIRDTDRPVRKRVADFRRWAERHDRSLEPAFEWCDRATILSEERTEVVRLPLVCVAIYDDDRLIGVFPHSTGDGTETVDDCLDRIETGVLAGDLVSE